MANAPSLTGFKEAYTAGEKNLKAGRQAEARKDFEKALACAATDHEKADAILGVGASFSDWAHAHEFHVWSPPDAHLGKYHFERLKQFELAQAEFEKVLAISGISPNQEIQARIQLARIYYGLTQYNRALAELHKCIAMDGVSAEWLVQALMFMGYYTRYGCKGDPFAVYAKVHDVSGVTPAQKAEVHLAVVETLLERRNSADVHLAVCGTLLEERNRAEAHLELDKIFRIKDLPSASRALAQLALGKILFLESDYNAARDTLRKALDTKGFPAHAKAEAQLYIGLSEYYEGKDYERAGRELRKVLKMPGASYAQVHDATLRLHLRNLLPGDEKVLKVLFIGSSHTQVRNIPQIVELLAASAPAGRPRIIASQATFGGHTPQKLWGLGDGPGTPRRRIVSDPWDFLVIENTSSLEHVARFAELARTVNVRPILYETPVSAKLPYPDGVMEAHKQSLAVKAGLRMPVAPAAYAWMLYLGADPADNDRLELYHPDGVHTAKKGAYMAACAIYAALTGVSPVGLTFDAPSLAWTDCTGALTEEEALKLQEAAWKAVRESNPGLK